MYSKSLVIRYNVALLYMKSSETLISWKKKIVILLGGCLDENLYNLFYKI